MPSDTPPPSKRSSSKKRSPKENESTLATAAPTNPETTTTATTASSSQQPYADLIRNPDPEGKMESATLVTGLYGTRGERIKHVVYKGALALPAPALEILLTTIQQSQDTGSGSLSKKTFELPGIDSVVRPLADPKFPSVTVTDVYSTVFPAVPETGEPAVRRTVVKNRVVTKVPRRIISTTTAAAASPDTPGDAERIRGGGEGDAEGAKKDDAMDAFMPNITLTFSDPPAPKAAPTPTPPEAKSPAPVPTTTGQIAAPVVPAPAAPVAAAPVPSPAAPAVAAPVLLVSAPAAPVPAPLPTFTAAAAVVATPSLDSKPAATPSMAVSAVPATTTMMPTTTVTSSAVSQPTAPATTPAAAAPVQVVPVQSSTAMAPTVPATVISTNGGLKAPATMAASAAATPQPVASSVINKTVVPAPVPVRSAPTPAPAPVPAPVKVQAPAKPEVVALKKRPAPQWEQHTPGANDEMQVDPANKTPPPDWYKAGAVSDLEQTLLPEWFDGSAPHRTNKSYLSARETMIKMSDTLGNRYITSTMARRCIPGDAGSLLRLHSFLSSYALINDDAMNDSAPTPMVLQKLPEQKGAAAWNETLRDDLMEAVVEQSSKRPKLDPSNDSSGFVPLNWNAVAAKVGHGATPDGCEREFLGLPLNGDGNNAPREGSITPDGEPRTNGNKEASKLTKLEVQQEIFQELVTKSDPAVIRAVTEASLQATGKLADAQKTAIYGLVASQAEQEASTHEDSVARVLSEIVDLRMKKLENRMSLMDDIEGMLEAERIALELERRDLYTARCRHWFGGP